MIADPRHAIRLGAGRLLLRLTASHAASQLELWYNLGAWRFVLADRRRDIILRRLAMPDRGVHLRQLDAR
jgi:hypothetical protein